MPEPLSETGANTRPLVLGSSSRYRRELLERLHLPFTVASPDTDEAPLPGEAPAAYVERVTGLKLDAALVRRERRKLPDAPVLCADTTVALGRRIYGKPLDAADAARMLAELSGRTHRVLTAVALQVGNKRLSALSVSSVRFAQLDAADIAAYVATGEPRGKAGAYGVQGRAGAFIPVLHGSYSGIMGLPLFETAQLLRAAGFTASPCNKTS